MTRLTLPGQSTFRISTVHWRRFDQQESLRTRTGQENTFPTCSTMANATRQAHHRTMPIPWQRCLPTSPTPWQGWRSSNRCCSCWAQPCHKPRHRTRTERMQRAWASRTGMEQAAMGAAWEVVGTLLAVEEVVRPGMGTRPPSEAIFWFGIASIPALSLSLPRERARGCVVLMIHAIAVHVCNLRSNNGSL